MLWRNLTAKYFLFCVNFPTFIFSSKVGSTSYEPLQKSTFGAPKNIIVLYAAEKTHFAANKNR